MLFVCYSRLDTPAVMSMVDDIRRRRFEVWIDKGLHGGQPWWQEILKQIRRCDIFVLALSDNAAASKPCDAELCYARQLNLPILPVQIGPVDRPHLLPVADLQIVDYRTRQPANEAELHYALVAMSSVRRPQSTALPPDPPEPYAFLAGIAAKLRKETLFDLEQADIINTLESALDEDNVVIQEEIVHLLDTLGRRRDLLHKHAKTIDAILETMRNARAQRDRVTTPPQHDPPNPATDPRSRPDETQPPSRPDPRPKPRLRKPILVVLATIALVGSTVALIVNLPATGTDALHTGASTPSSVRENTSTSTAAVSKTTATPPPLTTTDGLIPQSTAIPPETLAVTREVDGKADIYLVNSASGEESAQVTVDGSPVDGPHEPPWPAISPDRRSIIYVVERSPAESSLRVMAADGREDRDLFKNKVCDRYLPPAWNPIRQDQLAMACQVDGHFALMIVKLDGTVVRNYPINNAWVDDVSVSPDGSTLTYFSGVDGDPGGSILVAHVEGDFQPVNLTQSTADRQPVWSADGSQIAFTRMDPAKHDRHIWVMSADGSDQHMIGPDDADNDNPSWSPGGESLAFRSNMGQTDPNLYRYMLMDANGGNVRPLTASDDAPAVSSPAWGRR